MGAEPQQRTGWKKLGEIGPSRIKEIFLAQMAKVGTDFTGNVPMIVDDQTDAGPMEYGKDLFGQAAYFIGGCAFGAELNQIRAAIAQLLSDRGRLTRAEPGGVDECVKAALRQWLHKRTRARGAAMESGLFLNQFAARAPE
jgi:hypothetical protein